MKRKLNGFLRQRHLKITDVVLIVILGLMMSIQVIRWSGREIRQSQAAIPQSEQVKLNFIQKVAPIAESEQRQSHVLASITIAQAALESDWGQSELSQKRSEEHTSELQSRFDLVCRLLLEKKNTHLITMHY